MANQEDFNKVISSMISGIDEEGNQITANNFSVEMLEDFKNQKEDFWKWILEYMKSSAPSIKQSDLNDPQDNLKLDASVFGYINEEADLDRLTDFWAILKSYYLDASKLDETTTSGKKELDDKNYFWNESMSRAIVQYLLHFDLDTMIQKENEDLEEQGLERDTDYDLNETGKKIKFKNGIKVGNEESIGHMHISDIINADAGYTFNDGPWVKPQYNVDGELYRNVRGKDKILSVLKSSQNLQYTVSQNQNPHWLRLLMPEYLRYVEVEDLNRNFWVIGQTIAALSAYLFDDDSPINEVLKNLLNEIAQLWQNIMYLWAAAAALSKQDYYETFHIETVLLPNNSIEHYIKFDNFENSNNSIYSENNWDVNWEEIKSRLNYLVNSYSKQNLILIPVIKTNNYKHNYYQTEIYPGIMIYNRNLDKWAIIQFDLKIDAEEYQERIYAIRENEETYDYYFPLSTDVSTINKTNFFGMIYTDINIDVPDNPEETFLDYFFLSVYDRGSQVLYNCDSSIGGNRQLDTYELRNLDFNYDEITHKSLTKIEKIGVPTTEEKINEIRTVDILKGFYLGELISFQKHTIYTVYNINTEESISALPVLYNPNDFDSMYYNNSYNSIKHFEINNCTSVKKIMENYFENSTITQIERINSFKNYLTYNAAIDALQWIYDIQHTYYEDSDGNYLAQKFYNYGEIMVLIKEKCGFTISYIKQVIESLYSENSEVMNFYENFNYEEADFLSENVFDPLFIYWIKSSFIPYLRSLGDSFTLDPTRIGGNLLSELEINRNKYFCYVFLISLFSEKTSQELSENISNTYRTHDYVSGATVNNNPCHVCDYDELILNLYGGKYLLENQDKNKTFRFITTSRDTVRVSSIHSVSRATIISTPEGKVLDGQVLKDVMDRYENIQDIPLTALRADQFVIQGYYDQGSYRKGMLLVDPIQENKKITSKYEAYPFSRVEEGGMYTGQLGYNNNNSKFIFNGVAAQPVWTFTQFYVLTFNGENLTSNNWCLIRIDMNYFNQMSYYWGTTSNNFSKRTKFEYVSNHTNIIAPNIKIDDTISDDDIEGDIQAVRMLITEQQNLYNYYQENGLIWFGKDEVDMSHFVNQDFNFQCSIFCYRNDGLTARQVFVRDTCSGDTENPNYLKWNKKIDEYQNGNKIDVLIQDYKVISNTHPGYNYAKYLTNGKYIPLLESGDLDDSNVHFDLQFEEKAQQREEMS